MDRAQLQRTTTEVFGPRLQRLQQIAGIMVAVGAVLTVLGWLMAPGTSEHPKVSWVLQSYLYAYMFWMGVTCGSLALLMLHHVVGGGWAFTIRRLLEAASRLFPLMLVLFIPIVIGMPYLYEWTHPDAVAASKILQAKTAYLNQPFWIGRAIFYFAVFTLLATLMNRWGAIQDERFDPSVNARLNVVGAAGILIYVLTVTFMGVDWIMSLTPEWFSSIYGLLTVAMQGLSTLALMLVLFAFLTKDHPLVDELPKKYFRDLANLMLATVMLWAYMSFSQYLIIFSANLAEEVGFYMSRRQGGWGWVSVALIPLHFALPFLILLIGSAIKRDPQRLAKVALFLIVARLIDQFWWVAPTFRDHVSVTTADLGTPLLIGGIWLWMWAGQMERAKSLAPVYDPRLHAELEQLSAHAHAPAHGAVEHG